MFLQNANIKIIIYLLGSQFSNVIFKRLFSLWHIPPYFGSGFEQVLVLGLTHSSFWRKHSSSDE